MLHMRIQDAVDEMPGAFVTEVAMVTQDPALQGHRIRARAQHADIVVRFDHHRVEIFKMRYDVIVVVPHVGGDGDTLLARLDTVADRIRCVMIDGKRDYAKVADGGHSIRKDRLQQIRREITERTIQHHLTKRAQRAVDRNLVFTGYRTDGTDMIDVFMREENRLHIRKLEVQRVESLIDSLHRHPHIHQHMRMVRADVAAVPAGATGDTRKSHKTAFILPFIAIQSSKHGGPATETQYCEAYTWSVLSFMF